jgi:cephalosporin hydroxylase
MISNLGRSLVPRGFKSAYRRWLVAEYHKYYYLSGAWTKASWLGVTALQAPGDMVVLAQIIYDTQPELVVETGTHHGGTTLFIAGVLDQVGRGQVLSVDLDHTKVDERVRAHPRVLLHQGDSTTPETAAEVHKLADGRRTMLYLDADHSRRAVLAELTHYADLVPDGCYAIVADSNLNGHPIPQSARWMFAGEGPYEAIQDFLAQRKDFEVDRSREYQLLTFNPNGFLKRVSQRD